MKELAQIGAAIGRRFSFDEIMAVTGPMAGELQPGLEQLVAAELGKLRCGVPPDASYQFKHALVQDAAYASLVRDHRAHLHGQIARAFEKEFPEIAVMEPETLAHHFAEAGEADAAIAYWLRAGQRAVERSADREAIRHLRRGIAVVTTLPDLVERDRRELELQMLLGTPLVSVYGYTNAEVGTAAEKATELADKVANATSLFACLYRQYTYLYQTGNTRKGLEVARRLQALGASGDRIMQMMAHRALGVVLNQLGDFANGRGHLEHCLALYDREGDRSVAARFMTDPFASTSSLLSVALWVSGFPAQAKKPAGAGIGLGGQAQPRSYQRPGPLCSAASLAFG